MASYNRTILMGHLTRDPEIKYLTSGSPVGNFSLAVNERYKDKQGEQREDVAFIECEVWGTQAENCGKYLEKGQAVLVEGKLKQESWEDKDSGKKRSKLKVVAHRVQFLAKPEITDGVNPSAPDADDNLPF